MTDTASLPLTIIVFAIAAALLLLALAVILIIRAERGRAKALAGLARAEERAKAADAAQAELAAARSDLSRLGRDVAAMSADAENAKARIAALLADIAAAAEDHRTVRGERDDLSRTLERERAEARGLERQIADLKEAKEQMRQAFAENAGALMASHSETFKAQNREQIEHLLTPLKDDIVKFKKSLGDAHEKSLEQHGSLKEQIAHLSRQSAEMSKETVALTRALKGNVQKQGAWGEMIVDTILTRLAKHIEKAMKLKGQIKSAMVYPSAILGVAGIVISVLMIWVIPVFERMFSEMSNGKVGLPGPTQIVIDISNLFQSYWYIAIGAAVAGVFVFKKYYATPKGRMAVDRFLLKTPVFGDLIRKASVAKFTRTLGTLLSSGVPLLDGLTICAKTSGNKVIEEALFSARISISGGKTIADPLAQSQVFPKMVTHMIAVGESTGALDAMLGKIADFYEDEVDQAVASLTALLEPVMMVFLGVVIGFIVIAMYLPIFQMASAIG